MNNNSIRNKFDSSADIIKDNIDFVQVLFVYIFISKGQVVSLKLPFPNSENYGNETQWK